MSSRCSRRTIRGALPSLKTPSPLPGILTLSLRQQTWQTVNFSDYRVVILNWDDTFLVEFITPYTAAIPALEAYVGAGGVVWVQAAIQGNPGDNFPMPFGGQGNGANFSDSDNVVDPASPMMINIPNPMEGNAASHVSYTGLPGPAHTVVINPNNNQTVLYDLQFGGTAERHRHQHQRATITPATPTPTATVTPTVTAPHCHSHSDADG